MGSLGQALAALPAKSLSLHQAWVAQDSSGKTDRNDTGVIDASSREVVWKAFFYREYLFYKVLNSRLQITDLYIIVWPDGAVKILGDE